MKTLLIVLISFLFVSCSSKEGENNSQLDDPPNKANYSIRNLTEGTLTNFSFVNYDSTELHMILWTGWRYSSGSKFNSDSITAWIQNHPTAIVKPILGYIDQNNDNSKQVKTFLSIVFDSISGDTLQIDFVKKGLTSIRQYLPVINKQFQNDSCYTNSETMTLLCDCSDFKKYLSGLTNAHNSCDSIYFEEYWVNKN